MPNKLSNDGRKHEGNVHEGVPETLQGVSNIDKEDRHPAKDAPKDHGEIPRKNDDSEDDKKDPFQAD
ncbi:hypothetical protein ED28_17145 [[Pantoea] beijingensis]|uniref:Uncharacterized protein n=1 Tax=[Pantoea] beijingensis TaxID=1324864 RepID=A0A443I9C6_9GAMM|nr:hypothetical protein [[Pantoea] beijingensis]RWR00590.1 hypothetical protein ED28_17145 [[Pantoea] beijingensis]